MKRRTRRAPLEVRKALRWEINDRYVLADALELIERERDSNLLRAAVKRVGRLVAENDLAAAGNLGSGKPQAAPARGD